MRTHARPRLGIGHRLDSEFRRALPSHQGYLGFVRTRHARSHETLHALNSAFMVKPIPTWVWCISGSPGDVGRLTHQLELVNDFVSMPVGPRYARTMRGVSWPIGVYVVDCTIEHIGPIGSADEVDRLLEACGDRVLQTQWFELSDGMAQV